MSRHTDADNDDRQAPGVHAFDAALVQLTRLRIVRVSRSVQRDRLVFGVILFDWSSIVSSP
jgi:hypothetical protein